MQNLNPNNLAAPNSSEDKNQKRKMTQAILEDQEKEKEQFEFLEDDDDFEEFENDEVDYDELMGNDVEMDGGSKKKKGGEDFDKKLW